MTLTARQQGRRLLWKYESLLCFFIVKKYNKQLIYGISLGAGSKFFVVLFGVQLICFIKIPDFYC